MFNEEIIFQDRQDAGQRLAKALNNYTADKPIILGIPRGGVVVAYEIAQILKAPLDIIVARKIGAPSQPEYAIGAIAPGDIRVLNVAAVSSMGINETEIETLILAEKKEMARRIKLYRGDKPPLDLKDRVVIVVDDGIATGYTALAAVRSVRKMQPRKIIFACGVAAPDSVAMLKQEVDEVICISLPRSLYAVGQWYRNFGQTTDDEVIQLLRLNFVRTK